MKKNAYIFFVSVICSFIVNTATGNFFVNRQVSKSEALKVCKKIENHFSFKSEENESDSNTPLKNKKRKRPKGTETNGYLIHERIQHLSFTLNDFVVYFYNIDFLDLFFINGKRGPPCPIA